MHMELDGSPVGNSMSADLKTVGVQAEEQNLVINVLSNEDYLKKLEQIAHIVGGIHFAGNFKVGTHSEAMLDELLTQVGANKTSWDECVSATEKFKLNEIEYVWRGVRKVWG